VDASVKSILPPQFWSVGIVFAAFFGLLTVASKWVKSGSVRSVLIGIPRFGTCLGRFEVMVRRDGFIKKLFPLH
jgi:hypothetical protein